MNDKEKLKIEEVIIDEYTIIEFKDNVGVAKGFFCGKGCQVYSGKFCGMGCKKQFES